METILKQLVSPEWWFTVVAAGLLVGIVAAYAKDWISSGLSHLSGTYQRYSQFQKEAERTELQKLSSNPPLLLIEYVRACLLVAASVLFIGISFLLPAWGVLQRAFPEVDPTVSLLGMHAPSLEVNSALALAAMFLGLTLWISALRKFRSCEMARTALIKGEA